MLCLIKLNERTYIVKQYIRIINVIEYFFLFLYAKIYIGANTASSTINIDILTLLNIFPIYTNKINPISTPVRANSSIIPISVCVKS